MLLCDEDLYMLCTQQGESVSCLSETLRKRSCVCVVHFTLGWCNNLVSNHFSCHNTGNVCQMCGDFKPAEEKKMVLFTRLNLREVVYLPCLDRMFFFSSREKRKDLYSLEFDSHTLQYLVFNRKEKKYNKPLLTLAHHIIIDF